MISCSAEWCFGFQSVAVITNCRVVFNEIGPDGAAATADEDDRLFPKCLRTTRSPVGKFPDVPFGGGPRMYIQFFWLRTEKTLHNDAEMDTCKGKARQLE
ncbi:unnamed protein product [Ilex paraguariensis]|uniref:Uncharacterized protein n=1 Tax=Ilex paraguariensis TaxID=185542 RepID=A0ABC8RNW6_9AQUA